MASGLQREPLVPIRRRDGRAPCGECHLQSGEVCDICGAIQLLPEVRRPDPMIDLSVP